MITVFVCLAVVISQLREMSVSLLALLSRVSESSRVYFSVPLFCVLCVPTSTVRHVLAGVMLFCKVSAKAR